MRAPESLGNTRGSKLPVSALLLVYTPDLRVLLLERADFPDHWQSVTGSRDQDEGLVDTARREVLEETGIDVDDYVLRDWHVTNEYEIFPQWRHRYPPGTTVNTEHVFSLDVGVPVPVRLSAREHARHVWLRHQAAATRCFSWSNRDAILALPQRAARDGTR